MGLDWEDHQNTTIKTDGGQEKHAGVHVEVEKQSADFAHVSAEDPVEVHGGVGDVQGQKNIEQEVGSCQVEEPDCGDRFLHLEDNCDDQAIAQQTQEAGEAVDESSNHLNDGQGVYLGFFAICVSNRVEVIKNIVVKVIRNIVPFFHDLLEHRWVKNLTWCQGSSAPWLGNTEK